MFEISDRISGELKWYKQVHKIITVRLLDRYYDITKIQEKEKSNFSLKIIKNCIGDTDEFNAPYFSKLKKIETRCRIQAYNCGDDNDSIKNIINNAIKEIDNAIEILLFEPIVEILNNKTKRKYVDALYELYRNDSIFHSRYTYAYSKPDTSSSDTIMRMSFSVIPDIEKVKKYIKENNVIENIVMPIFNLHTKNHTNVKLQRMIIVNSYFIVSFILY